MRSFWVTFYSYKGGVGRSMALANVAAHLVSEGRRVVIIDFDLEAPGLDAFEEFGLKHGEPGVVEYVAEYLKTDIAPPIGAFVQRVTHPNARRGELWVMPAGRKNEEYNRLRAAIDWADLYERRDGTEFIENFKADIERQFRPDYVFVDSRTGLTDVGGVCTLHLPDLVVLVFSLNEQNLQGVSAVARVLSGAEGGPVLLPVASPVPDMPADQGGLLMKRIARAVELLGSRVVATISYSPWLALKEQVIVWGSAPCAFGEIGRVESSRFGKWDEVAESAGGYPRQLATEYEKLAGAIQAANSKGLDQFLREVGDALENLDLSRARDLCAELEREYPDRFESWSRIADLKRSDKDLEGYETALRCACSFELAKGGLTTFGRLRDFLLAQKRYEDLLDLITEVRNGEALDSADRILLDAEFGEWILSLNLPEHAVPVLEEAWVGLESGQNTRFSSVFDLQVYFNLLEARRRSHQKVPAEDWRHLIRMFEKRAYAASAMVGSTAWQLKLVQSLSVAYAITGDEERAIQLLREAERMVSSVSPRQPLTSVISYTDVSRDGLLRDISSMIAAIEHGHLWDFYQLD